MPTPILPTHDRSSSRAADAIWRRLCDGLSEPWLDDVRTLRGDQDPFETTLDTTRTLARNVPPGRLLVSESGLNTPADLADMARHGARTFLIGESLMRQADVATATRALLADPIMAKGAA